MNYKEICQKYGYETLSGANLRHTDLRGADLSGADLYKASLCHSNLRGADLSEANLYGADLKGANLSKTNLKGANLRWADLHGSDLRETNLRWADLYNANLLAADLREADLYGADMDYGMLPLSCYSLYAHFDDKLIYQILYHAVKAGIRSPNVSEKLKKELYKINHLANKFHRVGKCGPILYPNGGINSEETETNK